MLPDGPGFGGTSQSRRGRHGYLVVLTGNPNSGKTTLFNALTGLRARVANYPGVTVERKEGTLKGSPEQKPVTVIDLPGSYSLSAQSLDEQIARDVLLNRLPGMAEPDLIVVVLDASNLERHLYYATQVVELGYPTILVLNRVDVAKDRGYAIDVARLASDLGVPVYATVARDGDGLPELTNAIMRISRHGKGPTGARNFCELSQRLCQEVEFLATELEQAVPSKGRRAETEALLLLGGQKDADLLLSRYPARIAEAVRKSRGRLDEADSGWRERLIRSRYSVVRAVLRDAVTGPDRAEDTVTDRLDRILTHRVYGALVFVVIMGLMFQAMFLLGKPATAGLEALVELLGLWVDGWIARGDLHDLVVNGVIAGVGAVAVFVPQICLLFLFIGLLEESGYMARAALLLDRLMSKVGLHGKSFIPLLSSFACAVPGIMAARTIESSKDRLITVLIAPLMSCSARLPVYTLLIGACVPERSVLGFLKLGGLTLLAMYLLGIAAALMAARLFKKVILKGHAPLLVLELPSYQTPKLAALFHLVWDRARLFLHRAGTVILGANILIWFLTSYPRNAASESTYREERARLTIESAANHPSGSAVGQDTLAARLDAEHAGERLRGSFAGRLGRMIEPVIKPLGFDWRIGIGLITSFAAREMFVSTMSVVYAADGSEQAGATPRLMQTLKRQVWEDGRPVYTLPATLALMVFFVMALQCVSTVVVVRRETNSWRWPLFQWLYMGALAWLMAFLTYTGARFLGLG